MSATLARVLEKLDEQREFNRRLQRSLAAADAVVAAVERCRVQHPDAYAFNTTPEEVDSAIKEYHECLKGIWHD